LIQFNVYLFGTEPAFKGTDICTCTFDPSMNDVFACFPFNDDENLPR